MEYFDFEEASFASTHNNVQDDVASDCQERDETDVAENYESLLFDKDCQLHLDSNPAAENEDPSKDDDLRVAPPEIVPDPVAGGDYPMFRSTEPCDFCRRMGFDCFIIKRGVLSNGCTCCVSLYRECSFTYAKAPGKFLHTLHPVGEDIVTSTGGLTGRRALKSIGSNKFDDLEARGRKSGARFGRDAVRVLKTWLTEHHQHPYPSEEEKNDLKERTGLKRSQIANWLANARRRGKVRPPTRSASPVPGAVNISRHSSTSSSSPSVDLSLMTPLERWKHSPPEHEPASTSDIIRAMANPPFPPSPSHTQLQYLQSRPSISAHGRSASRKTGSSNDSSSLFQAQSVNSFDTENRSSISDFSFASAFSHRSSQPSLNSTDRKDRRRRRKQIPPVPPFERQKNRSARIFQCTFCTDSFPAKYDWQRHEKSLHLALEKWTCAPDGGTITTADGQKACVFCKEPNPTGEHLEMVHNFSACQEKTVQERTFYRKDHLNQHLRLMHNVKLDNTWMNQWRSTTNEIKSRCGFCDAQFTTWKDRVDHLAHHFKNGADISTWKGDWGFEPYVRRLVENAVPPYLIAYERNTPQPYKATTQETARSASQLAIAQDANCFIRLEKELKSFIQSNMQVGIKPSDQTIQDQARVIIYGSDDHWNQTCADNPVWLSVLKRDCGLEDVPESDHLQLDDLGMQPPFAGAIQRPPLETNPMAGHLRKSWLSKVSADNNRTGGSRSGMHSPGFASGGFHSAAPSMPGSYTTGSFAGSTGVSSGANIPPGLSSGWASSLSVADNSSSAPASVDPFAGMDFDMDFLEQFNDSFPNIPPQEDIPGLDAVELNNIPGLSAQESGYPIPTSSCKVAQGLSSTQPISIPASSASVDPSFQQYPHLPQYLARSNFQ